MSELYSFEAFLFFYFIFYIYIFFRSIGFFYRSILTFLVFFVSAFDSVAFVISPERVTTAATIAGKCSAAAGNCCYRRLPYLTITTETPFTVESYATTEPTNTENPTTETSPQIQGMFKI